MTTSAGHRRIGLGLLVALVLLAVPSSSSAAPFGPREEWAMSEAVAYWQALPVGCESIAASTATQEELGGDRGWTDMPAPGKVDCTITLAQGLPARELCEVALHEYGHLLGYLHSDPPMQVDFAATPECESVSPGLSEYTTREKWSAWREWRGWCRRDSHTRRRCFHRLAQRAAVIRAALG